MTLTAWGVSCTVVSMVARPVSVSSGTRPALMSTAETVGARFRVGGGGVRPHRPRLEEAPSAATPAMAASRAAATTARVSRRPYAVDTPRTPLS